MVSTLHAVVIPNSLFSHNAVLQRDMPVPIWGTATSGDTVTVQFDGQAASTVAENGKWMVKLAAHPAGGPFNLTIADNDNSITLTNILVGDVWVASGQSNMEDPLAPTYWASPVKDWKNEVAAADYPQIRQYKVAKVASLDSVGDVNGTWKVCSPSTAGEYTAAGYFFARDLQRSTKVPVGILFSAWGGTVAEAWTSPDSLKSIPDFSDALEAVSHFRAGQFPHILEEWYRANDPGSSAQPPWMAPAFDSSNWKPMKLPTYWQHSSLPNFNGIVWFRKEIILPESWTGKSALLNLGAIDDQDTTWVNGVRVGAMFGFADRRIYSVPATVLKPGSNLIAIRVLDTGGLGGVCGAAEDMNLEIPGVSQIAPIPLAGEWQFRETVAFSKLPPQPANPEANANTVTILYNSMIKPLLPYAIKGVIWYQGESNDDSDARARQYRKLFPLLISDWRFHWGIGDFPFLFVQIAPYKAMTPEIREAQFLTLKATTNTAMVVITDGGDPNDIHPANKQIVGARLAQAARALVYGEKIEGSGPLFESMKIKGKKAVLQFGHVGGGLVAQGGELQGFVICDQNKIFVPAKAVIKGRTVVVSSDQVSHPVAVRYGWTNVPEVNLYNKDGFPASPFRTDVD